MTRRLLALAALLASIGSALAAGAGLAAAASCKPGAKLIDTPSGKRWHDGHICTPGTAGTRSTTSTAPATETEALTATTQAGGAAVQSAPPAVAVTPRYTG